MEKQQKQKYKVKKCANHLQPDGPAEYRNPRVAVLDLVNLGDLKKLENLEVASSR